MIALRGKLERDKSDNPADEKGIWTWKGTWAFGSSVPADDNNTTLKRARSLTFSRGLAAPPQPAALPFHYTWKCAVDPKKIAVPLSSNLLKEDNESATRSAAAAAAAASRGGDTDDGNKSDKDAAKGLIAHGDLDTNNNEVVESTTSSKANSTIDETIRKEDTKDNTSILGKQTDSNTEETEQTDTTKQSKFVSFADVQNDNDPEFTDAVLKHGVDVCPPSGEWEGYFETLSTRRNAPNTQVMESCYLFLNATPSKNAKAVFEHNQEQTQLPLLPQRISAHGESDTEKLQKYCVHVRGMGSNQFGTFELIGSLDLQSSILQVQRVYVPVIVPQGVDAAATNHVFGRGRRGSNSAETRSALADSHDAQSRHHQTRKRQLSWKKRAALDETPNAAVANDAMSTSTTTGSADMGTEHKIKRSSSLGGNNLINNTGVSRVATKRLRAESLSSSAIGGASGKRLSVTLPTVLASPAVGVPTTAESAVAPLVVNADMTDSKHMSASRKTISHPSSPSSSTGSKKKSVAMCGLGSGSSGNATALTASNTQTTTTASTLSVNDPDGDFIRLPSVGDPALARWRAAHFLYYHRNGPSFGTDDSHNPTSNKTTAGTSDSINKDTTKKPKYVVYEGELFDGKREGRGVCLYSNGLLYEGSFKRDKEHGFGTLMTADRQRIVYQGEWERGRFHGKGLYNYDQSTKTINHTVDDMKETGSKTVPHESRYEGEFRENLRHGIGTYYLADGASKYEGSWRDDMMNGRGVFTWPDGSIYDGDWKDGKRQGQGILRASDGFVYDGAWVQNAMEGRGSAIYPNGQEFVGSFSAGRREGRGTIRFTNGAIYEGRFRDDAVDGQGTLRLSRAMVVPRNEEDTDPAVAVGSNDDIEKSTTTTKDDFMVPVSFQSDMGHIHRKAGFTIGGE